MIDEVVCTLLSGGGLGAALIQQGGTAPLFSKTVKVRATVDRFERDCEMDGTKAP